MMNLNSVCPASPTIPRTMLKILYTQEPDGEVFEYEIYSNRYDRQRAYQILLDEGYEIVGEA